jgi:hypothetical protein
MHCRGADRIILTSSFNVFAAIWGSRLLLPNLYPLLGEAVPSTVFKIVRNRMHMSFEFPIEEKP